MPKTEVSDLLARLKGPLTTYIGNQIVVPAAGPAKGVLVDGFPNMMMLMGPHTALGNIPRSIEYNVDWVTGLLRHARADATSASHGRSKIVLGVESRFATGVAI